MNAFFQDGRPAEAPASASFEAPAPPPSYMRRVTIEEMEREMILHALEDTGHNQEEAAERLGICSRTIRNKLRKYRSDGLAA